MGDNVSTSAAFQHLSTNPHSIPTNLIIVHKPEVREIPLPDYLLHIFSDMAKYKAVQALAVCVPGFFCREAIGNPSWNSQGWTPNQPSQACGVSTYTTILCILYEKKIYIYYVLYIYSLCTILKIHSMFVWSFGFREVNKIPVAKATSTSPKKAAPHQPISWSRRQRSYVCVHAVCFKRVWLDLGGFACISSWLIFFSSVVCLLTFWWCLHHTVEAKNNARVVLENPPLLAISLIYANI